MPAAKRTSRSRNQDRRRVAAGQKYEVGYLARKTGKTTAEVKKAIKKAGSNMRSAVEGALGGGRKKTAKKAAAKKRTARKTTARKGGAKSTTRKTAARKGARKSTARKTAARKSKA